MHTQSRFSGSSKPKPLEPPSAEDEWQWYYETCYGTLNLGETEVEHGSLHYLWHKLAGHIKWQGKQNEELWIMARQVAYWSMLPHVNGKNKKFTPQQLTEFPWEKEKKRKALKKQKPNGQKS